MLAGAAALVLLLATQAPAPAQASPEPLIPVHTPYLDLVWKYLEGDGVGPIADLARMPTGDLEHRVFADLERVTVRLVNEGHDDLRLLEPKARPVLARTWATLARAAAMLHVETGRYLMATENVKAGMDHLGIARNLMDWAQWRFIHVTLQSGKDKEAYTRLRRGVYLAIAYILQNYVQVRPLKDHLERARDQFPHDAEVLLASGSAEELASDREIVRRMAPPVDTRLFDRWRDTARAFGMANAEEFHREATERQPTLAEAHVHLGRVLHMRRKLPEARRALETARDLKPVSELGYLAALFLARLTEDEGHEASAFEQYAAMVKVWPDCHAPHIALSRLYDLRNDRQAALGALQPLWRPLEDRRCPVDPWWVYLYGQAWRLIPLIEALRAEVRS